jgi:hypothetical protein
MVRQSTCDPTAADTGSRRPTVPRPAEPWPRRFSPRPRVRPSSWVDRVGRRRHHAGRPAGSGRAHGSRHGPGTPPHWSRRSCIFCGTSPPTARSACCLGYSPSTPLPIRYLLSGKWSHRAAQRSLTPSCGRPHLRDMPVILRTRRRVRVVDDRLREACNRHRPSWARCHWADDRDAVWGIGVVVRCGCCRSGRLLRPVSRRRR